MFGFSHGFSYRFSREAMGGFPPEKSGRLTSCSPRLEESFTPCSTSVLLRRDWGASRKKSPSP